MLAIIFVALICACFVDFVMWLMRIWLCKCVRVLCISCCSCVLMLVRVDVRTGWRSCVLERFLFPLFPVWVDWVSERVRVRSYLGVAHAVFCSFVFEESVRVYLKCCLCF